MKTSDAAIISIAAVSSSCFPSSLQGGVGLRRDGRLLRRRAVVEDRISILMTCGTIRYDILVRIKRLVWPQERIDHIARHGVTPDEVEDVCFGKPWVRRAKSEGENPLYYVLGQTESGRYLFCVVIGFPDGNGYPVTAREMTAREKRRYRQWNDR